MIKNFAEGFRYTLNGLEILGIILVSLLVLGMQFFLNEPTCHVCALQRVGYLGIIAAFLLNFRFGLKPVHYAISLLFSSFTALAAIQQLSTNTYITSPMIHDATNTIKLYLYFGSVVLCIGAIIFNTIMIGIDPVYRPKHHFTHRYFWITPILFLVVILVVLSNIFSIHSI